MSDFENLEKFNLLDHGDYYEKQWWQLVCQDFAAYETFWRRYIVPLTNRVDPSISADSDQWIGTRQDVDSRYEKIAMAHYSVFYYLARATQLVTSPAGYFTKDAFYLLDSCADNVKLFFDSIRSIMRDLGDSAEFLPKQHPKDYPAEFSEIQSYRDVMLHNPVYGRLVKNGVEFLPEAGRLGEIKWSWRKLATLSANDFVDSRERLKSLRLALAKYLQSMWLKIIAEMDRLWDEDKFKRMLNLERFLPIGERFLRVYVGPPCSPSIAGTSITLASAQTEALTTTSQDEHASQTASPTSQCQEPGSDGD